jgi:hypothetical protein
VCKWKISVATHVQLEKYWLQPTCNGQKSQLQPMCNWKISVATNVQLKKSRLQQVCNRKNLGFEINVTGKISVNTSTMGKMRICKVKTGNILPVGPMCPWDMPVTDLRPKYQTIFENENSYKE